LDVGCDDVRKRWGWYIERAAAGEQFLIRRRGRALAKLIGAVEQPKLYDSPREAELDRQ
jgi:antitoxin (DNA-binding transcriptional repressor) of toxin-antitoxin stability system